MTNAIPNITVKSEVKKITTSNPNLKDVVCLIGGFENVLSTPKLYTSLEDAEEDLGNDTSYPANAALKQIFREDISGVLIVDITTVSDNTYDRSITTSNLESALASVAQMEFDLLYVAAELTNQLITVIDTDAQQRFEDKRPYGYIGVGTRTNESTYTTTAGLLGDFCYAFLTQTLTINDDELDLIESGAYLTNYIARLPVGNSLTAKILPEVTGVGTTYTFGATDLGKALVGLGYFIVRLINPLNNNYECVNSAGANGKDLYINRVRDYIVNDFALRQFLGERNNEATIDAIKMECNRLLSKFRDNLGIVENITYAVEDGDATNTVNVILNTIQFADIITQINVYITIEVV